MKQPEEMWVEHVYEIEMGSSSFRVVKYEDYQKAITALKLVTERGNVDWMSFQALEQFERIIKELGEL